MFQAERMHACAIVWERQHACMHVRLRGEAACAWRCPAHLELDDMRVAVWVPGVGGSAGQLAVVEHFVEQVLANPVALQELDGHDLARQPVCREIDKSERTGAELPHAAKCGVALERVLSGESRHAGGSLKQSRKGRPSQ